MGMFLFFFFSLFFFFFLFFSFSPSVPIDCLNQDNECLALFPDHTLTTHLHSATLCVHKASFSDCASLHGMMAGTGTVLPVPRGEFLSVFHLEHCPY